MNLQRPPSITGDRSLDGADADHRTVKSADRVLTLLELLGLTAGRLAHAKIAEHLGIPKSSLSQLMANLLRREWLTYHPHDKTYSIGPMFSRIAQKSAYKLSLADVALPILEQLSADTGETAALNELIGDEAETTATVLAKATLLALLHTGQKASLYSTSYGKIMLAHMEAHTLAEFLNRTPLTARTPRTLQSVEELKIQLDAVRRDGFAYSFEEHSRGIVGTARGVFAADGHCVAALNVAAAAVRYDDTARAVINRALERAAAKMSIAITQAPSLVTNAVSLLAQ